MTSDEQTTRRVTQLIAESILKSASTDERRAGEVDPAYVAEWMTGAQIKRRVAAYLVADGVTTEQVDQVGDLGVTIGPMTVAPPANPSYAQLEAHRDVLREIFNVIVPRINDTHAAMRASRSTLDTAALDPEDLQPDPLTSTAAESTGAHRAATGDHDVQGRDLKGYRVLVVQTDGTRSRGVLDAVTPAELLLAEPTEAGPASIPHLRVHKVLQLAQQRADAGIWERGADGRPVNRLERRGMEEPRRPYPTEPATGAMPGRESVTSGPHRVPSRGPGPAAETVVDASDLVPVPAPPVEALPSFAPPSPGLLQRLRDGLAGLRTAHEGGDRG